MTEPQDQPSAAQAVWSLSRDGDLKRHASPTWRFLFVDEGFGESRVVGDRPSVTTDEVGPATRHAHMVLLCQTPLRYHPRGANEFC